jgi:4-hydroxy-tetrahydrodipicolinate synthase
LSPGAVYAYFNKIALHTPIDVTLYNIPMFANPIDVDTVRRLVEFPKITAIKDSSGDIASMLRMMAAVEPIRPDFVFLTGWEPALVPMLAMGCQGGTLAMSGVVPEVTRELYDLAICGRLKEAKSLQMLFTELFDRVIFGANFPEGVRVAVERRGFKFGAGRQPLDESQLIDHAEIARMIDSLLASAGSIP